MSNCAEPNEIIKFIFSQQLIKICLYFARHKFLSIFLCTRVSFFFKKSFSWQFSFNHLGNWSDPILWVPSSFSSLQHTQALGCLTRTSKHLPQISTIILTAEFHQDWRTQCPLLVYDDQAKQSQDLFHTTNLHLQHCHSICIQRLYYEYTMITAQMAQHLTQRQ